MIEIEDDISIDAHNFLREKKFDLQKTEKYLSKCRKDKNYPRYLSSDEIDDILKDIFPLPSVISGISNNILAQTKRKLKEQLSQYRISPLAVPKIKESIFNQYIKSIAPAGESVGMNSASNITRPVTQAGLNAIHQKNSSTSSGVETISELFGLSKNRRRNRVIAHFLEKDSTREELDTKCKGMSGNTLRKLMEVPEEIKFSVDEKDYWWYDLYLKINNLKFPYGDFKEGKESSEENEFCYMRIYLNKYRMYKYDLLIQDVVNSINDIGAFFVVASPFHLGIIDIYVEKEIILEEKNIVLTKSIINISDLNIQTIFLKKTISENKDKIGIRDGIEGIEDFQIVEQQLSLLFKETRVTDSKLVFGHFDGNVDYWEIKIKKEAFSLSLTSEKFKKLFISVGFNPISLENETFNGKENTFYVESKTSPHSVIDKKYNQDKDELEERVNDILKDIENIENLDLPSYSDTYRFYNYCYAIFDGENIFNGVYKHSMIDKNYTYPNNPHEIYKHFGIEAVRKFLQHEYYKIITVDLGSDNFNPVNIDVLTDFQTALGVPTPVTSTGAAKQGGSAMSIAAFQDPLKAFQKAASVGVTDVIRGISGSIITGKKCKNGTGIVECDIILTPEENISFTDEKEIFSFSEGREEEEEDNVLDVPFMETPSFLDDILSGETKYKENDEMETIEEGEEEEELDDDDDFFKDIDI